MCKNDFMGFYRYEAGRETPSFWVYYATGPCTDNPDPGEKDLPTEPVIIDRALNEDGTDIVRREILFGDTESIFMTDCLPVGSPSGFQNDYIGMTRAEDNVVGRVLSAGGSNVGSWSRNAFTLTSDFVRLDEWLDLDEDRVVFNTAPGNPPQITDGNRCNGPAAFIFQSNNDFKEVDAFIDPDTGETIASPIMQQLPYGTTYGLGVFNFGFPLPGETNKGKRIMAYDFKQHYPDGFETNISSVSFAGSTDPAGLGCYSSECDPMNTGAMRFYAGAVDRVNPDTIDPATGSFGTGTRIWPAFPTFSSILYPDCRWIYAASDGTACEEVDGGPPGCGAVGLCHGTKENTGAIKGGYGQDEANAWSGNYRTLLSSAAGGNDTLKNRLFNMAYFKETYVSGGDTKTRNYCLSSQVGSCNLSSYGEVIAIGGSIGIGGLGLLDYGSPLGSPANPYPLSVEPDGASQFHYFSSPCTNPSCFPPYDCVCDDPDITIFRVLIGYSNTACHGISLSTGGWFRATVDPTYINVPGIADSSLRSGCPVVNAPVATFPN
jgi:hypothetical protein